MPAEFGFDPLYRKFAFWALAPMPGPLKACSQRPSRMKRGMPVAAIRDWPGRVVVVPRVGFVRIVAGMAGVGGGPTVAATELPSVSPMFTVSTRPVVNDALNPLS